MPVGVSNIKAADPGVAFTLEIPADEPSLGTSLRAVVTITYFDPQHARERIFVSEVWARDPINNRTMKCMAPFGDDTYAPGQILHFTIDLYYPCDAVRYEMRQEGEVMSTAGHFHFGSDMIVRVKDHEGIHMGPSTSGMPMMASEDGNYIGILHLDGQFIIFPQCVIGNEKGIEPTYTSPTEAARKIDGHTVSIYVSDGRAHFFANNQILFVSEQQLVGAYMVIQQDGFYLKKPASPLMPPEEIGPLTFR